MNYYSEYGKYSSSIKIEGERLQNEFQRILSRMDKLCVLEVNLTDILQQLYDLLDQASNFARLVIASCLFMIYFLLLCHFFVTFFWLKKLRFSMFCLFRSTWTEFNIMWMVFGLVGLSLSLVLHSSRCMGLCLPCSRVFFHAVPWSEIIGFGIELLLLIAPFSDNLIRWVGLL